MKHITIIILSIILTGTIIFAQGSGEKLGKVSFSIGKYAMQKPGQSKWKTAAFINVPVHHNDKLKTEKESRCEITFDTKKVMRIGQNSIVEITKDDAGVEEVEMKKGRAWLAIFWGKGKSDIRVKTPSSVCAVRGTVYRLDCDTNHTAYRCYEGALSITPFKEDGTTLADSTFQVEAGEELILVMDFEEYKKQQEREYREFIEKDLDEFERFKMQDQQQFQDMVEKDMADFKRMNNIDFKQSKFDREEDKKLDWVRWNNERDRLLRK